MQRQPSEILIYHITDAENLQGIIAAGGLLSDVAMQGNGKPATVIGYAHIKQRRMTELRIGCCGNRFVGEFVPFYFCPRSPMLLTINSGSTGRPRGCQQSIVHLVSRVSIALAQGRRWSISDGNAGASHASFYTDLAKLSSLDWDAIRATRWQGRQYQKSAEFLLADRFDWTGIQAIGCYNSGTAERVKIVVQQHTHQPTVTVEPGWYY